MDCCNYMQHRQSYYGSQYYESGPAAYHHDFQHHQYASDMQQYGAPNWGFAASCSDYVYNPKEARIRKALRDRERSIVNSSTARSRRSNWSRQSPAPQMPPIAHASDPHMNVPSKDFRSAIRHELEHGFLHNNGGYIYPSQNYLFTPQSEYMSYINAIPSTNWPPNTYNMQNNNMVQQQIWNQYQTDRVRSQQQQQQQNYLINAQGPPQPQTDYQMEQHMPANNVQMGQTLTPSQPPTPNASKSRMQQNIENAASDVDRYLNIPRNNIPIQLDHQMPMQMVANATTSGADDTTTTTSTISIPNESNHQHESTSNVNDLNIGNVMPEVELDNSDNAESGFVGGIQLFNEQQIVPPSSSSTLNNTTDNRTNQMMSAHKEIVNKNPLPDFNQAFGSTERGRFQSPPDPRLGPDKEYLDFFNDAFNLKTEQYPKWIDTPNPYNTTTITTSTNNNNNNNQNFNLSF